MTEIEKACERYRAEVLEVVAKPVLAGRTREGKEVWRPKTVEELVRAVTEVPLPK